jgi:diadenosine tetraphosphate (Ap4A) HIT family hydrolase
MKSAEALIEKFSISANVIHEDEYWTVSLRPRQPTIGSLIVSLKRDCTSLGELTTNEAISLGVTFRVVNATLTESFSANKINYLCLMMMDPQVHFHVIPRYADVIRIGGGDFADKFWPGPPDIQFDLSLDSPKYKEILEKLRQSVRKIL